MFESNSATIMCALFTGNTLISLDEVNSTNTFLSEWAEKEKLNDGTVVFAAHQTAGKGQRGSIWQSNPNENITISILYYPVNMPVNKQFLLTQAISLGVYEYLNTKSKQVKIKWPNDLYIANKKVGGLLIENTIKGENIFQTIIGLGLNINQQTFKLPKNNATSLSVENNEKYEIQKELNSLLTFIERRYLQWNNGLFSLLHNDYLNALYLFQSWHIFQTSDGQYLDGKIIGTNEQGQLLITDVNNEIHKFGNKEIQF